MLDITVRTGRENVTKRGSPALFDCDDLELASTAFIGFSYYVPARTIIALLTYGEQPSGVVILERRYGPRRLRDDDDDDVVRRQ